MMQYSIYDLLKTMERLRDPETGCPWDIKQTFATIAPSTIEEAYEVVDAIEHKSYDHLKEELGDLLFQVVFYAQMGKEQKLFDFEGIVSTLVDKLVRRHPHVFPSGDLSKSASSSTLTEADVKQNWEAIKQEEREQVGHSSLLDDVPIGLPALARAQKLQKRAARASFDWVMCLKRCKNWEKS